VLSCLDKLGANQATCASVAVVAVTHRPASVHALLRRSGRLADEVILGVPDLGGRREILRSFWPAADEAALGLVASRTPGYVGADLARLAAALQTESSAISEPVLRDILKTVQPSGQKSGLGTVSVAPISWNDVRGLEDTKALLKRVLEWPLKFPHMFQKLGIRPSRGCLLYGPPGKEHQRSRYF